MAILISLSRKCGRTWEALRKTFSTCTLSFNQNCWTTGLDTFWITLLHQSHVQQSHKHRSPPSPLEEAQRENDRQDQMAPSHLTRCHNVSVD
ncbi:hypothetical protein FOPG_20193 [Fusarium oxysporum f. sp. conglutinans race 2 54008]|uniref:Uncharacterized protein n=1 Tax=Fusarium oxysporum f. sp. conglutinans race 2 54008 TaxID=1089457 RepID=X0GJP6_FUSOX|nr:hypothetical protein FOPG_20193 [Fusarium oxysporum f. sp. conglutinans race 2 54008]